MPTKSNVPPYLQRPEERDPRAKMALGLLSDDGELMGDVPAGNDEYQLEVGPYSKRNQTTGPQTLERYRALQDKEATVPRAGKGGLVYDTYTKDFDKFRDPASAAKYDPADVEAWRSRAIAEGKYLRKSDTGTPGVAYASMMNPDGTKREIYHQGSIYKDVPEADFLQAMAGKKTIQERETEAQALSDEDRAFERKLALYDRTPQGRLAALKLRAEESRINQEESSRARQQKALDEELSVPLMLAQNPLSDEAAFAARSGDVEGFQRAKASQSAEGKAKNQARAEQYREIAKALLAEDPDTALKLMDRADREIGGAGLDPEIQSAVAQSTLRGRGRQSSAAIQQLVPDVVKQYEPNLAKAAADPARGATELKAFADDMIATVAERIQQQGLTADPAQIQAMIKRELRRVAPRADESFWSNIDWAPIIALTAGLAAAPFTAGASLPVAIGAGVGGVAAGAEGQLGQNRARSYNVLLGK